MDVFALTEFVGLVISVVFSSYFLYTNQKLKLRVDEAKAENEKAIATAKTVAEKVRTETENRLQQELSQRWIDDQKRIVDDFESRIRTMREDFESERKDKDALRTEMAELQAQHSKVVKQNTELLMKLEQERDTLKTENEKLKNELTEIHKRLAVLEAEKKLLERIFQQIKFVAVTAQDDSKAQDAA